MIIAIVTVLVLAFIAIAINRIITKHKVEFLSDNNILVVKKHGKSLFKINNIVIPSIMQRYNALLFLNKIDGIEFLEDDELSDFTVSLSKKHFLIITAHSNNRKESHKMYEIYVCPDFIEKILKPNSKLESTFVKLYSGKEVNCNIIYKPVHNYGFSIHHY